MQYTRENKTIDSFLINNAPTCIILLLAPLVTVNAEVDFNNDFSFHWQAVKLKCRGKKEAKEARH